MIPVMNCRKLVCLIIISWIVTPFSLVKCFTIHQFKKFSIENRKKLDGNVPLPCRDEATHACNSVLPNVDNDSVKKIKNENAIDLVLSYISRLWRETSVSERRRIANPSLSKRIKSVQHILQGREIKVNNEVYSEALEARYQLLESCKYMLDVLEKEAQLKKEEIKTIPKENSNERITEIKKKPRRSILFGAMMGLAAACWVYSGNYIFTALFTLMTIIGQLEYYRMVMNVGIYPARRISTIGASAMFISALFAPNLHQIILPIFAAIAMIWFLTLKKEMSSIAEIATTFTGMFYIGYIPSFWVRTRLIGGGREPTRLAFLFGPMLKYLGGIQLPEWFPKDSVLHLPITTGATFIFWTWLSIAFSDVGAYAFGRKFGKTKLRGTAGQTSPNKTVEGVIGGCLVSAIFATTGALVQKWPYWFLTGPIHGIVLALLGLTGDLTASMLKRDAELKDFGDLLPEHGGILDRVDSFIFTAPYSWLVCLFVIPQLKKALTI